MTVARDHPIGQRTAPAKAQHGEYDDCAGATFRRTREIQLKLLDTFVAFCNQHQLNWFVMYGTLLGAARHGGFIPWDDDIDLTMPRADFEVFQKLWRDTADAHLQTPDSDPEFYIGGALRLRHHHSTTIEALHLYQDHHAGVFIDITALDYVPDAEADRDRHLQAARHLNELTFADRYSEHGRIHLGVPRDIWRSWQEEIGEADPRFPTHARATAHRASVSATGTLAVLTQYTRHEYELIPIPMEWFGGPTLLYFEQRPVNAPVGYLQLLDRLFGPAWGDIESALRLADRTKHAAWTHPWQPHWSGLKNARRPFAGLNDRTVAVFGAARQWTYLRQGQPELRVDLLVDSNEDLWGQKRHGVTVSPPSDLERLDAAATTLIVATRATAAALDHARDVGITDVRPSPWVTDLTLTNRLEA